MDIDGFSDAIDNLNKKTTKTHERNIKRLDDILDIYDEPSINIKILYKEEKRIPTLMSLYKTTMNYLNYMDIETTVYNEEYDKIKKKYDDTKKKDTRELLFNSIYTVDDLYNKLAEFYKDKKYTAYVITYIY